LSARGWTSRASCRTGDEGSSRASLAQRVSAGSNSLLSLSFDRVRERPRDRGQRPPIPPDGHERHADNGAHPTHRSPWRSCLRGPGVRRLRNQHRTLAGRRPDGDRVLLHAREGDGLASRARQGRVDLLDLARGDLRRADTPSRTRRAGVCRRHGCALPRSRCWEILAEIYGGVDIEMPAPAHKIPGRSGL
jgi:hypothetical protein